MTGPDPRFAPEGRLEPPLAEMLADPIFAALWRADGVDPGAFRAQLVCWRERRRGCGSVPLRAA